MEAGFEGKPAESCVEIVKDPKTVDSYIGRMADLIYNFCKDSRKRRNRCR